MQKLFPSLEYHEWEGVGHFLMMEEPDRFNRSRSLPEASRHVG
jgi:pimeloyl-ACP methyl ester carboxylesterase